MGVSKLIGIRELCAGSGRTLVLLMRNEGGSVAGQCLLEGAERPIIDGPTTGWVLTVIEDTLEALVLSRRSRTIDSAVKWEQEVPTRRSQ